MRISDEKKCTQYDQTPAQTYIINFNLAVYFVKYISIANLPYQIQHLRWMST
jgi:hypothetical protein